MARVQYADISDENIRPLVSRIRAERGEVPHLYSMLLQSPPIAEGWLTYLTAVRQKTRLEGGLRELVIIRIAQLNGAPYEAEQHLPIARKEGVSETALRSLGEWEASDSFDDRQRAALAYTDVMTRQVQVSDPVFKEVSAHFDAQEIVELTATIAAYNMVSRFLEALAIRSTDIVHGGSAEAQI